MTVSASIDAGQKFVQVRRQGEAQRRKRMPVRKTKKMLDVEKRFLGGRGLEKAIPEMLNEEGFTETAKQLKLSKATLNYWMLKLGIEVRRVALAPGEEIEIKRSTG